MQTIIFDRDGNIKKFTGDNGHLYDKTTQEDKDLPYSSIRIAYYDPRDSTVVVQQFPADNHDILPLTGKHGEGQTLIDIGGANLVIPYNSRAIHQAADGAGLEEDAQKIWQELVEYRQDQSIESWIPVEIE